MTSLVRVVCEEPRSRRFSSMNENDLLELWKDVSIYINSQLRISKSVFIPGLAHFYVNKDKNNETLLHYVPAHTWDKIPGLHISRPLLQRMAPSETLNFSAISQDKNYSRDLAETALKDLTHSILNLLLTGNSLNLNFPKVGNLQVFSKNIKFRFDPELSKSIGDNILETAKKCSESVNDGMPPLLPNPAAPEEICIETSKKSCLSTTEVTEKFTVADIESVSTEVIDSCNHQTNLRPSTQQQLTLQQSASMQTTNIRPKTQQQNKGEEAVKASEQITGVRGMSILEPMKGILPVLPPLLGKSECWTEDRLPRINSPRSNDDSEFAFLFGLRSVKDYHTHPHSGNRLWSNSKCPLCLQLAAVPVDYKAENKKREIDHDRMLLNLSLEVDREFILRKKELENVHYQESYEIANYNKTKAVEIGIKKKQDVIPLPMGNITDTRVIPPHHLLLRQCTKDEILEQIANKKKNQDEEKSRRIFEDRVLNKKFVQQFKKIEFDEHTEKLKKQQQHCEDLNIQVQEKYAVKEKDIIMENKFANDETSYFKNRRDKARKLYQEQLNLLQQKKDYEKQVLDIQRKSQIDRLAIYKIRLEQDFNLSKKNKYDSRKALESYWLQQMKFRNANLNPYDA
ncbi:Coiled-coil domain-containing protein 81 [Clydaea vesicula]|uniref:Coiled-coil domain-containing protein 81 n=1 Tax=Clydaea vesicula TaxID=447962 RepID=A0AAD5U8H1_9FUNG|nr:Coiled-coil domain-containing protein 81 [Clydaea vesicula]